MVGLTRVYVPATDAGLVELGAAGSLDSAGLAFAVTPALRAWVLADGPADDEQLELVALSEAARHSLRLLGATERPARRVVVAADVDDAAVTVDDEGPDAYAGQVRIDPAGVPVDRVAAVLVDGPDMRERVEAAVRAVAAADDGDPAAEALLADLEDHDLLWFVAAEIGSLTSG